MKMYISKFNVPILHCELPIASNLELDADDKIGSLTITAVVP